ncbi:MAG: CehA/McbA family metallohydrolase [Opitutales bacterium]|nr:CehA/McbA family metallohydrolase [Opitutales bacterium]MDG1324621.1 CehA/McbA family metallohydrolase [Opitutales bacterium]
MKAFLHFSSFILLANFSFAATWHKGNTHVHTKLCGHADSTPEVVAQWYHDHGYNFLILSEHNKYIDPTTVKLSGEIRDDFLMIPGEEVTGPVHSTAMNVSRLVPWDFKDKNRTKVVQWQVEQTKKAGGITILNHPNAPIIRPAELYPVKDLYLFELYNAHPHTKNFGDAHRPSTSSLWNALLDKGMTIYGVASDDSHKFARWDEKYDNPGRGWVMVRSDELSSDAITLAMNKGEFYSSSGVILKKVIVGKNRIEVQVDEKETSRELASKFLFGRSVKKGKPGTFIEFIGPGGEVLETISGNEATRVTKEDYMRCMITHRVKKEDGSLREYYAWTQPVFTDGR